MAASDSVQTNLNSNTPLQVGAWRLLGTNSFMDSLDKSLQSRDTNNLDFLRCLGAVLVIFSHCFPILGIRREPLLAWTGYTTFGSLGVNIFFLMSGLLVTRSWLNEPSVAGYLRKRCLRIFPGLLAATLFCVLIVGPLGTMLNPGRYFTDKQTYEFLWNVVSPGSKFFLPGVFHFNPTRVVNGSWWTLPYEFICYLLVLFFGLAKMLNPKRFPLVAVLLLGVVLRPAAIMIWHGTKSPMYPLDFGKACYVYFLIGMAACFYGRYLPMNRWAALFAAALILGTASTDALGYAVSFFSIPYLILYAIQAPAPWLKHWARRGDLSYGMYIYAFPIQGLIVHFLGMRIEVATLFFLTVALTMIVAYFSWHYIEKPALAIRWNRKRTEVRLASPETMQTARTAA